MSLSLKVEVERLMHSHEWLVDANLFQRALSAISSEAPGPGREPVRGVVSIRGLLMKDAPSWAVKAGWATDFRAASQLLDEFVGDPSIDEILLDIESPGGSVAGTQELADAVFEARKSKRIVARVEDLAASAAYWIAAQADEIEANESALIGSIGVYSVLKDWSQNFAQSGIKVDVVRSTPLKGTGIVGAPISEGQREKEQEIVNGMAELFSAAVARGRGMTPEQIKSVSTGELWLASEAKKLGLIDRVRSASTPSNDANQRASAREAKMANEQNQELAALRAELDKAKAANAELEGQRAALEAEREAHKAALLATKESSKAKVISAGVSSGRITPPMRAQIENYAKHVEPDVLEAFVSALPQQTTPNPIGSTPLENKPAVNHQDDAKFVSMFPGLSPRFADAASEVVSIGINGFATLKDGRMVPVGQIGKVS